MPVRLDRSHELEETPPEKPDREEAPMNVVIIDMPGKQFVTTGAKLGIEDLFFPFDAPDHCGCMSGNLSEGTVKEENTNESVIFASSDPRSDSRSERSGQIDGEPTCRNEERVSQERDRTNSKASHRRIREIGAHVVERVTAPDKWPDIVIEHAMLFATR